MSDAAAATTALPRVPGVAFALIVLCTGFAVTSAGFVTPTNIANILVQSTILLLLALPMTLIIMTEGLDLSMGAVLSLAGVVLATMLMNERGLPMALAAAVGVGLAFGVANGILVVRLGLPPFVARQWITRPVTRERHLWMSKCPNPNA